MYRKVGIVAAVLLTLAALAIIITIAYKGSVAVHDAEEWVNHTYSVLQELDVAQNEITESIMRSRGYMISGNKEYLEEPTRAVNKKLSLRLIHLQELTEDNPVQQKNIEHLTDEKNKLIAYLDDAISAAKKNPTKMQSPYMEKEEQILSALNEQLRSMKDEEEGLLEKRQDLAESAAKYSLFSILILVIIVAVLMTIAILFIRSSFEERRMNEESLRDLSENLSASNARLQEFAMVVSHDLQEPLRKVQAFGERLKNESDQALSDKAQDYLDRMMNASRRMQELIQSLLTLSRVQTTAKPFSAVDLKQVVSEVLSDLETRIEQSNAKVETGDLPVIEADPTQMRQLFQNLIGNALKYKKEDRTPEIKISCNGHEDGKSALRASQSQMATILVEDNGIGFEQEHAERIFGVFQRLHAKDQYEGTGIGLAVCRRIVERHNGKINAKSTPDVGTTFVVTLPIKQIQGKNEGK